MNEVEALVKRELERAKAKHGETFSSDHEAMAVAWEEVQEAQEEMGALNRLVTHAWGRIRRDKEPYELVKRMEKHATHLAEEAAQVAAVCRKWQESKREEEQP